MNKDLISICVPAYDMGGLGGLCLKQLLQTIKIQEYKNFEVIISDHSTSDNLKSVVESFNDPRIFHFYNENKRGSSSANTNNAIKLANSNNIKVMFQDDFFVSKEALDVLHNRFKQPHSWGVSSCIHYAAKDKSFYRPFKPYWQQNIKNGENTLGCPSVLFFKKSDLEFDTDLLWFMDTDFYYRLFLKFGPPVIEEKILVGIRTSDEQVTNTLITNELIEREAGILKIKYFQHT